MGHGTAWVVSHRDGDIIFNVTDIYLVDTVCSLKTFYFRRIVALGFYYVRKLKTEVEVNLSPL